MVAVKKGWVPLKFDLMAKKVFGDNKNQNQIKFLLKQILNIDPLYVKVLNTKVIDRPYKDKKFEVDLLVKIDHKTYVGIEINTSVSKEITDRNLFYMTRIMSRDLKPKESFKKLYKHIQISFDFKGRGELPIMSYQLLNKETLTLLSDKMKIIKVSVPYFYDRCYNKDASLKERFIGFLNEENKEKAKLLIRGDKNMEELYDKVEEYSDDEIIGLYDLESHRSEVERSVREEATRESFKKGLEQGIEQGLEQAAKQMKKENIDIETISKVTGLSIEEIKRFN